MSSSVPFLLLPLLMAVSIQQLAHPAPEIALGYIPELNELFPPSPFIQRTELTVEFAYRTVQPFLFPHRFRLYQVSPKTPRVSFSSRLSLQIANTFPADAIWEKESTTVEGWVVGVHYDNAEFVEFTVVASFQRILQVVFLIIPHSFVDYSDCPQFRMRCQDTIFWTYMCTSDIAIRVDDLIYGNPGRLTDWKISYWAFAFVMNRLRCTPYTILVCHDPRLFFEVSLVSLP